MIEFLDQAVEFIVLCLGLVAMLITFAFYKAGWSKAKFKENWIHSEGDDKPMWRGIMFIIGVPLLMGLVLYAGNVKSAEYKWFDEATVYVGLDYTENTNPLCGQLGASDRISSNMGFTQSIVKKDMMNINMKYTHHSCAISADQNSYDAVGVMIEWTIK